MQAVRFLCESARRENLPCDAALCSVTLDAGCSYPTDLPRCSSRPRRLTPRGARPESRLKGDSGLANARGKLASVCLFILTACTPGPLEGGRYACHRDAGGSEQCPEDWRCATNGFCRKVGDVSQVWRCALDADCEGGWVCGLSSSRDFRECHDPKTVAAAFACTADTDCVQQWRCGLEGVCHSPAKAAAYVCRSDAGLEDKWCEQGWRCLAGLRVGHRRAAADGRVHGRRGLERLRHRSHRRGASAALRDSGWAAVDLRRARHAR